MNIPIPQKCVKCGRALTDDDDSAVCLVCEDIEHDVYLDNKVEEDGKD